MPKVARKEKILEKASGLFRNKGYHGTTIRDISEASGILSGSLYAHIRSKEDLLFEITDRGAEHFLQSVRPIIEGEGDAITKLRKAMVAHVQVITDHLEAATVFFHEWKSLTDERRHMIQTKRDEYEGLWAQLLVEGMNEGCFRKVDEKFARLLILSAMNGLYQWYQPDGEQTPIEVAERYASILLAGLAHREGSAL
ncbi:TetR/AcrR family transcriptional regulator [Marininema halotolerans]|uniref:DNA-binding transcriptional regulator, AcrR family n=1 Tax=Marininema halotolerans TaxID=1155944 RepID=A0A1I6UJ68_9BACL|nr:TetR/AcrR family transcriptional regulator [Marininema halotolerans]SFT01516.1 DNA-binding transcriptional regulator, AcrR family [Marininema halotolerans]